MPFDAAGLRHRRSGAHALTVSSRRLRWGRQPSAPSEPLSTIRTFHSAHLRRELRGPRAVCAPGAAPPDVASSPARCCCVAHERSERLELHIAAHLHLPLHHHPRLLPPHPRRRISAAACRCPGATLRLHRLPLQDGGLARVCQRRGRDAAPGGPAQERGVRRPHGARKESRRSDKSSAASSSAATPGVPTSTSAAPTAASTTTAAPQRKLLRACRSDETHAFSQALQGYAGPQPSAHRRGRRGAPPRRGSTAETTTATRPRPRARQSAETRQPTFWGRRWRPCTTSKATPRGQTSPASSSPLTRTPREGYKALKSESPRTSKEWRPPPPRIPTTPPTS